MQTKTRALTNNTDRICCEKNNGETNMAVTSIKLNYCSSPGNAVISGTVNRPHDPVYACITGSGGLLGSTMADAAGNFTLNISAPPGTYRAQLTDVPGGSGTWSTPIDITTQ